MSRAGVWAGAMLAGMCLSSGPGLAQNATAISVSPAATGEAVYAPQVVPVGTPVRLMFTREINSRTAASGQQFKMRVDEPVYVDGKPVVPVGTTAWGEIIAVDGNGAVGRGGRLGMKILYLDLPQGRLPLRGEERRRGGGNGAGVALAVVGFGLLGLFTAGDSARFKAGDMLTVYVDAARGAIEPVEANSELAHEGVEAYSTEHDHR